VQGPKNLFFRAGVAVIAKAIRKYFQNAFGITQDDSKKLVAANASRLGIALIAFKAWKDPPVLRAGNSRRPI
jgi:hypothetical protein